MNKLTLGGVAVLTAALALPALAQDEKPEKKNRPPKGERHEMMEKMFEKVDVDNSGGISLKEMEDEALARTKERFEHLDADKSGEVTKEEFKPPMGPRERGKRHRGDHDGPPEKDDAPDA